MKFTVIVGLTTTLAATFVSAQNVTSAAAAPAASAATSTAVAPPAPSQDAPAQPPSAQVPSCAVQGTFELCLRNEDNYIRLCQETDNACLCRWHREKLTCWNNCPKDEGLRAQEIIVNNYCSMPGANVSITPWTSTAPATSVPIAPTYSPAMSASSVPTTPTNPKSDATALTMGQAGLMIGAMAAYILF
ncbi:hypothetical protein K501DRAFT_180112 [Backusella circina FSU 941]|nr:hypothetical protein K501DRAFT_180112 [Backusella circina FSU 941]